MDNGIALGLPEGYAAIPAPNGGGTLLVGPDHVEGSRRNVVRVQPPGTGSSDKWMGGRAYYVAYNSQGAAISVYSGKSYRDNSPSVHNPFGYAGNGSWLDKIRIWF